jgi:hypothetical protein
LIDVDLKRLPGLAEGSPVSTQFRHFLDRSGRFPDERRRSGTRCRGGSVPAKRRCHRDSSLQSTSGLRPRSSPTSPTQYLAADRSFPCEAVLQTGD